MQALDQQLADALWSVNVEAVAREANVSTKTIYRLRHKKHAPSIKTFTELMAAVARIKKAAKR